MKALSLQGNLSCFREGLLLENHDLGSLHRELLGKNCHEFPIFRSLSACLPPMGVI